MTTKLSYERPELTSIGSLEAVTHAASGGSRLDASFATDTPVSDLTFS